MQLEEALHIAASVLTISFAFAIVWTGLTDFASPSFATAFAVILVTVGIGFILHELAHKYIAIHFKCHAEYRAWTFGLLLAVATALIFGFVFAAPGAVYIFGRPVSRKQNALISLAGPLTNLLLSFLFLLLAFAAPFFAEVAFLGARVNIFLGLFNLLPFFPMDGEKVYAWNTLAWGAIFSIFVLVFLSLAFVH